MKLRSPAALRACCATCGSPAALLRDLRSPAGLRPCCAALRACRSGAVAQPAQLIS